MTRTATDECTFCHHRRDAHARAGAHNSGRGCAHCDCPNFDQQQMPTARMASTIDGPAIAARFHEWYEHYAPAFGYETRPESAVPWERVPENNRRLMSATVVAVLTEPHTVLCWEQDGPGLGTACDRAAWHTGPHSWEADSLLRKIATARRGDCGGQEWSEMEDLPDEIEAMHRAYFELIEKQ